MVRFGVVCAFATDSQLESGAAESSDTLRTSLRDVYTFFNETLSWTRTLLVTNYEELEANLLKQQQSEHTQQCYKSRNMTSIISKFKINETLFE